MQFVRKVSKMITLKTAANMQTIFVYYLHELIFVNEYQLEPITKPPAKPLLL